MHTHPGSPHVRETRNQPRPATPPTGCPGAARARRRPRSHKQRWMRGGNRVDSQSERKRRSAHKWRHGGSSMAVRLNLVLSDSLNSEIEKAALERETTKADVLIKAIALYVAASEGKSKGLKSALLSRSGRSKRSLSGCEHRRPQRPSAQRNADHRARRNGRRALRAPVERRAAISHRHGFRLHHLRHRRAHSARSGC